MTKFAYGDLTEAIIGAYYDVYNLTLRTYPEYIYERAMIEELHRRGIAVTKQDEYDTWPNGQFAQICRQGYDEGMFVCFLL